VGAVLPQFYSDGTERPVVFASQALNAKEKNYAQIEWEALGIDFGVCKFYQYFYGRTFMLHCVY